MYPKYCFLTMPYYVWTIIKKHPAYRIEQNRTKNGSNRIEHLILCEFDFQTDRTNPVWFCLDCISWCLKLSMKRISNHNQPLLTGFRWCNIQDFDNTWGIYHNFCSYRRLYSIKQTNRSLVINQTFHYDSEFDNPSIASLSINEGSIVFDCRAFDYRPFDNQTFDFVRLPTVRFCSVHKNFVWVWSCSILEQNQTITVRFCSIPRTFDPIRREKQYLRYLLGSGLLWIWPQVWLPENNISLEVWNSINVLGIILSNSKQKSLEFYMGHLACQLIHKNFPTEVS